MSEQFKYDFKYSSLVYALMSELEFHFNICFYVEIRKKGKKIFKNYHQILIFNMSIDVWTVLIWLQILRLNKSFDVWTI